MMTALERVRLRLDMAKYLEGRPPSFFDGYKGACGHVLEDLGATAREPAPSPAPSPAPERAPAVTPAAPAEAAPIDPLPPAAPREEPVQIGAVWTDERKTWLVGQSPSGAAEWQAAHLHLNAMPGAPIASWNSVQVMWSKMQRQAAPAAPPLPPPPEAPPKPAAAAGPAVPAEVALYAEACELFTAGISVREAAQKHLAITIDQCSALHQRWQADKLRKGARH
jgi:hypothetical protein